MRRVLALAFDGADYELVLRLMGEGKLPTISRLAREGTFGRSARRSPRSRRPRGRRSSPGLNPGGHGVFNFTTNPNRGTAKLESAASRGGTPIWRLLGSAGVRSAYVGIPFTYPAEEIDGIVVTGYGGPETPQVTPASAAEKIFAAYPDLVTAHHPMAERWWEDFPAYTERLDRARRADGRRLQALLRDRAGSRPARRRLHEHRPRRPSRLRALRP